MYLRTNRHTGTERFLNLEGLIRSLERDGARDKEVTKLTGILGKGGLVDKGHSWYRAARPLDGVREAGEEVDRAIAVLLAPTERAAKELELFSTVFTFPGPILGGEIKDDNVQDQAQAQEANKGGSATTEQG